MRLKIHKKMFNVDQFSLSNGAKKAYFLGRKANLVGFKPRCLKSRVNHNGLGTVDTVCTGTADNV